MPVPNIRLLPFFWLVTNSSIGATGAGSGLPLQERNVARKLFIQVLSAPSVSRTRAGLRLGLKRILWRRGS